MDSLSFERSAEDTRTLSVGEVMAILDLHFRNVDMIMRSAEAVRRPPELPPMPETPPPKVRAYKRSPPGGMRALPRSRRAHPP